VNLSQKKKTSSFDQLLQEARAELKEVHAALEIIFAQLTNRDDYWRMANSWTFGIQEYVEAVSFYHFLQTGKLISKQEIEELMQSDHSTHTLQQIPLEDYLLGLGDIAGELMRYATFSACLGNYKLPAEIASFLQNLYLNYSNTRLHVKDWDKKVQVMLESLVKVETVCYKLQIRGKEYPKDILADILSSTNFEDSVKDGDYQMGDD